MVISTGKELISFAERHRAIISQHIWEALTDLDKCAPKPVVENCHSLQQLKAEIAALATQIESCLGRIPSGDKVFSLIAKMRQLSAV